MSAALKQYNVGVSVGSKLESRKPADRHRDLPAGKHVVKCDMEVTVRVEVDHVYLPKNCN